MPEFGRYKTVRELYRMGFIVVYSGRAADSPEEKFAIKAFQASALLLEKEQAKTEPDLFLNSASVQQKTSAGGAQHWAPIYEHGPSPDGAYYVTDKYDYSLQQLIDGRAKLTVQTLYAIIESVVKGLIELKQTCSRPHGNLKATNVLIAGAEDLSRIRVVLSDPLPDDYIDAEVHWEADLRAIVEFIYQLVMYRPSPAASGWQIPETEEWKKLGKQANDWRNLCNRLLAACAKPGTMTIETLPDELAKLKAVKPIPTKHYAAAAGLIGTLVVVIWWLFFHKPPTPPQLEDWKMLCSEYTGWVEGLHKASKDKKNQARWRENPDLARIQAKINSAAYPDAVARNYGTTVESLRDLKTQSDLNGVGATKTDTDKAVLAVREIRDFFDPNTGGEKVWPFLRGISEDSKNFTNRGWQRPAAYIGNLVSDVKPEAGNKTIAENVNKLLDLDRRGVMRGIREYLGGIAKNKTIITGMDINDPVLDKFDDLVNKEAGAGLDEAGQESIKKLNENLESISRQVGELADVIRQIERDIKEGKKFNPREADKCDTELKDLRQKFVRETIEGIDKKETIGKIAARYKPLLDELRKEAQSTIESAEKYVERIQQLRSISKSDRINEKWNEVKKYFASEIKKKPETYSDLRQNAEQAKDKLVALDEELQTYVFQELVTEPQEKGWHQQLGRIYKQEQSKAEKAIVDAVPMKNYLPDINEASFRENRFKQYDEFARRRNNLAEIVKSFDAIENGLELYYSLEETLPEVNESVGSLWEKWKDKEVIKQDEIAIALKEPIDRIEKLTAVGRFDKKQLVEAATDSKSRPEIVYAVWVRLGSLENPKWPNEADDWENDKKIQETLRARFEAIKGRNQSRADELLKMLDDTSIGRCKTVITANSFQINMLLKCDEAGDFKDRALKLADFVTGSNWQNKKFRTDLLNEEAGINTFEEWLKKVDDYRIIETDPRTDKQYTWDDTIKEIDNGLADAQAMQDSENLRPVFDELKKRINDMRALPAIQKNKEKIGHCVDDWKDLLKFQEKVKPPYCNYLNLADGRIVFSPRVHIGTFEPVTKNSDGTFAPSKVHGWKEIQPEFFYSINKGDVSNMGWPKYIRSPKDPSIILAFIPAGGDSHEPFYMAAREITNAQYCLFLNDVGARDTGELKGGAMFVDRGGKQLISVASFDYPPCAIKYNKSKGGFYVSEQNKNAPVTWITFAGANSYADWLSGQLPTASQHRYACLAGADTKYPWGNDLTQIQLYAHVRAAAWQRAAGEYNSTIKSLSDEPHCPIGAVKKDAPQTDETLDITKVIHKGDAYKSAWPLATTTQPNAWGLYDMIGNVWEWCRGDEAGTHTVICGGSCLAAAEYTTPDAKYDFKGQDCDVGFRLIVKAK